MVRLKKKKKNSHRNVMDMTTWKNSKTSKKKKEKKDSQTREMRLCALIIAAVLFN